MIVRFKHVLLYILSCLYRCSIILTVCSHIHNLRQFIAWYFCFISQSETLLHLRYASIMHRKQGNTPDTVHGCILLLGLLSSGRYLLWWWHHSKVISVGRLGKLKLFGFRGGTRLLFCCWNSVIWKPYWNRNSKNTWSLVITHFW